MKLRLEQKLIGDKVVDGRFFVNDDQDGSKGLLIKDIAMILLEERGHKDYWIECEDAVRLVSPAKEKILIKNYDYNKDIVSATLFDAELRTKELIATAKKIVEIVEKIETRFFEWEI